MKQKFFTNTIQSSFIKNLVYNTPIPIINTVNNNSYLFKDNIYIHKKDIIQCTKSGIFKMPIVNSGEVSYYKSGDIQILSSDDVESGNVENIVQNYTVLSSSNYDKIDTFHFGMYYPKFTELYHSNDRYYDSATHEKLGQLLRCYRDLYEINLMPYYNCISGDYISNIKIYEDGIKEESTDEYKTYKVPIKFNTTYTFALDCLGEVHIAPVLLSRDYIISDINYVSGSSFNPNELLKNNIKIYNSLNFNRPITLDISTSNYTQASVLQKYEKYLYLLIQMPRNVDSSIVLLEGDYTKYGVNNVYNIEGIDYLDDLELSNILNSKLSLLQFNDKTTYPYANRLIEYLLLNVITSQEIIAKNIARVQQGLVPVNDYQYDVWDNKLRSDIFLNYQNVDFARQLDLNGFVDKDTEAIIKKLS